MNEMMETIETFDSKNLPIRHIPGPEGVRGRNSDNELILSKLGWEPTIKLRDGLRLTYDWIKKQLAAVRTPSSNCSRLTNFFKFPHNVIKCLSICLAIKSLPNPLTDFQIQDTAGVLKISLYQLLKNQV